MTLRGGVSYKALLAILFWGMSFVATRIALEVLTPFALICSRMVLASLTLLILTRALGYSLAPPAGDRRRCALMGLILAGHLLIQAVGLLKTTATNTGWIIGFAPITIALGAWLFLKQPLTGRAWGGIALGTTGVLLICLQSGLNFSDAHFGDLLQVTSCVTWAAYTLLAVGAVQRRGSLAVSFTAVTVAAVAMLPTLLLGVGKTGEITIQVVLAVLFLGVTCSGLAIWLWAAAVHDVGSASAGAYLYLEPFVTWVAAAAVLGERIAPVGIAGGVLVLIGVWAASAVENRGDTGEDD